MYYGPDFYALVTSEHEERVRRSLAHLGRGDQPVIVEYPISALINRMIRSVVRSVQSGSVQTQPTPCVGNTGC